MQNRQSSNDPGHHDRKLFHVERAQADAGVGVTYSACYATATSKSGS
jgi:hypothetical protein